MIVDGRRVGRYELRYELSSGGMGTVYLARLEGERGLVRAVALKCLHPHLARSDERVDMFFDEVRVAARIRHPNVCPVLDFGIADGVPFLAMEFVHGETLASIERAAAPLASPALARRLSRLLVDVCEGLHAAHELRDDDGALLGVVHRDVTPRNLFLGYDGIARVVDFGVAHAVGNVHQTESGQLKGTLGYVAPEALLGAPVDRRADVWALGVVAWQFLTAQRLFRREGDLETLRAITEAPLEAPSRVRPGVPRELDAVVMRALERDPERRWASARVLGEALHEALASLGGAPHPAELSRWMGELFPGLGADKEALERGTRLARDLGGVSRSRITAPIQIAPPARPPASGATEITAPTPELSLSDIQPIGRPSPAAPPPPPAPLVSPASVVAPVAPAPASPSRAPLWAGLAALAAAAVLLGASVALYLRAPVTAAPTLVASASARAPLAAAPVVDVPLAVASPPLDPGPPIEAHAPAEGEREQPSAAADPAPADPAPADPAPADPAPADPAPAGPAPADPAPVERAPTGEVGERPVIAARPEDDEPRSSAPGHVSVSARGGWADLYHRGRHLGRTPTRVQLPAGRQVIDVRPFGQEARRRLVVTVPSEGEISAVVELD